MAKRSPGRLSRGLKWSGLNKPTFLRFCLQDGSDPKGTIPQIHVAPDAANAATIPQAQTRARIRLRDSRWTIADFAFAPIERHN